MEKLVITGGKPLYGRITVSGAKNSVIAIIPAAILVDGIVCIENVPDIEDVHVIIDILRSLHVKVKVENKTRLIIDSTKINSYEASYDMAKKMRASYYLLGALIGRFNQARVALPGGCDFGVRPIDQHIKGFEALGCETGISHGVVHVSAERLRGSSIYMDVVTVGATINLMLAATLAEGITVIENAAKEPHIVDLANFLNAMGAQVRGAGTDIIKIKGVKKLHGGTYSVIPDQIEAGTYMIAAAAAGGDVIIDNVIPKHMESVTAKLIEMNADVIEMDDAIRVRREGPLKKANVKTLPYPGFPTDLQPPIVTLLSIAKGTSIVTENVWDSRFRYVDELKRMGANIKVDGKVAVIEGVESLSGAPVRSTDLRAGAAMVIAGLTAQGVTEIHDLRHIDRGYEKIEEKLAGLGAQMKRIRVPDLQDAVV